MTSRVEQLLRRAMLAGLAAASPRCASETMSVDATTLDASTSDSLDVVRAPETAITPPTDGPMACDASVEWRGSCNFSVRLACGAPSTLRAELLDGGLDSDACRRFCLSASPSASGAPGGFWFCSVVPAPAEQPVVVNCNVPCPIDGRRPAGFQDPPLPTGLDVMQRFLSTSTILEAVSVVAFEHLARELAHHGAPDALHLRALRAAEDERRHTLAMRHLARCAGVDPALPTHDPGPVRAMFALALENAVEGCVRELFGAAVARWQGVHASAPEVRVALRRIAVDEARHADLAWDVAAWVEPRLSHVERADLARARAAAWDELLDAWRAPWPESTARRLGLPSSNEVIAMLQTLRGESRQAA